MHENAMCWMEQSRGPSKTESLGQGTSKVSASAVAALTSASKGSGRPAVWRKNPMGKSENPRVFGTEHLQKEWKISRKTDLNVDVGKNHGMILMMLMLMMLLFCSRTIIDDYSVFWRRLLWELVLFFNGKGWGRYYGTIMGTWWELKRNIIYI